MKLRPMVLTAGEQLREIRYRLRPMIAEQMLCLQDDILPKLAEKGIELCSYKQLNEEERKRVNEYFLSNVFAVLTPQAVDESHPFPYISNLSLNLGLMVEPNKTFDHSKLKHFYTSGRFVRIKVPPNVPRLIQVNDYETRFMPLGELIAENAHNLFPNMSAKDPYMFRITRDADIELREDEAGDILRTMERELHHRRRFSFPVRIEVESSMPEEMIQYITGSIGLTNEDIYRIRGFLNIPDLMSLYSLERPELKDRPITYSIPEALRQPENIFEILKKQDVSGSPSIHGLQHCI